jgi:hypothetical protein
MRKVRSLLVVAGLCGGLLLAAVAPSGASVSAKPSSFCKAVKRFDIGDLGNPTSKSGANKSLKSLEKLQATAKGKTKKAMNTIVDAYEQVADGTSARKAFGDSDVVKAFATFGLAAGKCLISDLPEISLPELDVAKVG